jgi:hypothetical protein
LEQHLFYQLTNFPEPFGYNCPGTAAGERVPMSDLAIINFIINQKV